MKKNDLAKALKSVFENRLMLLQKWREFHG
jgi:hypothetical protein